MNRIFLMTYVARGFCGMSISRLLLRFNCS